MKNLSILAVPATEAGDTVETVMLKAQAVM